MELKKIHWFGIVFGLLIVISDFIFFRAPEDQNLFFFLIGIAATIMLIPFVLSMVIENKREQDINEMFLEFSRNLAEGVGAGTPISKSVVNLKKKNYGPLSPNVEKLANQIELGIPVHIAMHNFSRDVDSSVIKRAFALIMEAERAGGEIDYILESVAKSISEIEKLKKERKAAVYNLVVQGYIIFFIFIVIMLVMEFKILPLTASFGSFGGLLSGDINSITNPSAVSAAPRLRPEDIADQFLYLLITQGFFAGLTIGKLAEGSVKAGIKHSFILSVMALLISTGARYFLSPSIG